MRTCLVLPLLVILVSGATPSRAAEAPFRAAIVLSIGGIEDHGFNEAAYLGAMKMRRAGLRVDVYEPGDILAIGDLLESAATRGYDLVCAIGCLAAGDLKEVATRHPERRFAIVDAVVLAPNVASYVFRDAEGSHLAGSLAALVSKKRKVAFLGGMKSPVIDAFRGGFEAGAKAADPGVECLAEFAGDTPDAFVDPGRGRAIAESLYAKGADVLFTAAGLTGLGAIEAAKKRGRYVIGVDADQNGLAPERMLASVLKRIDAALERAVADRRAGAPPAVVELGIAEGGIGVAWSPTLKSVVTAKRRARAEELFRKR